MGNRKDHPVWEVYDLQRESRFRAKYWSAQFVSLHRRHFVAEYMLMATAPGSAIAGLVFWNSSYGKIAWSVLTVLTAFVAVAKPLLKYSDRLVQLKEIVAQYRSIDFQLEVVSNDIRREQQYSAALVSTYKTVELQVSEIAKNEPIQRVNQNLSMSCYEEVKRELPSSSFYVPEK